MNKHTTLSVSEAMKNGTLNNSRSIQSVYLSSQYYKEYFGADYEDLSVVLLQEGKPVYCILAAKVHKTLTWASTNGVYVLPLGKRSSIDDSQQILSQIANIATEQGCHEIKIATPPKEELDTLSERLLTMGYKPSVHPEMVVSFSDFSETTYRTHIRKSYKSLINYGRKNFNIRIMNAGNLDAETFKSFQNFHVITAGRTTRSDASWQRQYEAIAHNLGFLVLAYYGGKLIGGSLFIDHLNTSIYAVGVYDRELSHLGISHSLVYTGILHAATIGKKDLFLGLWDTNIRNEKEKNIQFFKKGFASHLRPTLVWELRLHTNFSPETGNESNVS